MLKLDEIFVIDTTTQGLKLDANSKKDKYPKRYLSAIKSEIKSEHGINGEGYYGGITYPALSLLRVVAKDEKHSLIVYAPSNYTGYNALKVQLVENEVLENIKESIITISNLTSKKTKKVARYVEDDMEYTVLKGVVKHRKSEVKIYSDKVIAYNGGAYTPVNVLFANDRIALAETTLDGKYSGKNPFIISTLEDEEDGNVLTMLKESKNKNEMKSDTSFTAEQVLDNINAVRQLSNDEYVYQVINHEIQFLKEQSKDNLNTFQKEIGEKFEKKRKSAINNYNYIRDKFLNIKKSYEMYETSKQSYLKAKNHFKKRQVEFKNTLKEVKKEQKEFFKSYVESTLAFKADYKNYTKLLNQFKLSLVPSKEQ